MVEIKIKIRDLIIKALNLDRDQLKELQIEAKKRHTINKIHKSLIGRRFILMVLIKRDLRRIERIKM